MPQKQTASPFKRVRLGLMVLALASLCSLGAVTHADQFDDQINALKAQNNSTQGLLNGLESQAGSYQDTINGLQSQIDALQSQIAANQAQQAALQQQITDAQNKIDQQKKLMGEVIKAMYVDGQMSTIEELATSKNLSDYVDQEENRTAVQNKIDDLIRQIAALQAQLQKQKAELDELVANEQQQNAQLASTESQQQGLLNLNEAQQSDFNNQISANSGKIAELRREQIAANARFSGGSSPGSGPTCGGGYPAKWCEVPQDSVIDSWGMYNRECVSYTAFRVAESGRYMPYWGGVGNANQWPGDAQSAGIPVDSNPRAGDVAISTRGAFGHAMYVESVNGNSTINISQYNVNLDGRYSTNTISPAGLYFLHF
ncbi:MAG TPA: CHAP domain-containing protein [Candidatus Saccharimonadia bacterium]|nr:CHAP domain-containing protein [Candidatus Saccharimonadia bacterium]